MKFKLSSVYGELTEVRDHVHNGIDFSMPQGTTLRSITDGVVTKIFDGSTDIGKGVAIKTEDGTTHLFGHMSDIDVKVGEHIDTGDIIGMSGNTGHSTAPHLHFGVQNPDGSFVDPTPLADAISANSGDAGLWDKFSKANNLDKPAIENGQINNFEHADFSLWEWFQNRGSVNQYSEAAQNGENPFWIWIQSQLHEIGVNMWQWFILNLPDLMGFVTIGAGALIIFGGLLGKGGALKVMGWYSGILTVAYLILGGN